MNATNTSAGPGTIRKYRGFISYSHAADDRLAPALQSGLHRFAKPWYRLRAMRVFCDKTGLAVTPELWGSIQKALIGIREDLTTWAGGSGPVSSVPSVKKRRKSQGSAKKRKPGPSKGKPQGTLQ